MKEIVIDFFGIIRRLMIILVVPVMEEYHRDALEVIAHLIAHHEIFIEAEIQRESGVAVVERRYQFTQFGRCPAGCGDSQFLCLSIGPTHHVEVDIDGDILQRNGGIQYEILRSHELQFFSGIKDKKSGEILQREE